MKFTRREAEEVARDNYNLIHEVAKSFNKNILPYSDLLSAGHLGFAKSINTFDKSRGFEFSTYAMNCIRNEIISAISKERKHLEGDISMSAPISNTKEFESLELEGVTSNNVIEDMDVEISLLLKEDIEILLKGVSKLHARERFVIENRYGFNGRTPKSQKEIGDILNRTQPAISMIEKQAVKKLSIILKGELELENTEFYSGGANDPIRYSETA